MRKFLSFNFWVNLPETDLIMNRHHIGISPRVCWKYRDIHIYSRYELEHQGKMRLSERM